MSIDETMISRPSGLSGKDLSSGGQIPGAPRHRRPRRKDDEGGIPPISSLQHGAQRGGNSDPLQTNQLSGHHSQHRPVGTAQFDLEEASFPPLPGKKNFNYPNLLKSRISITALIYYV